MKKWPGKITLWKKDGKYCTIFQPVFYNFLCRRGVISKVYGRSIPPENINTTYVFLKFSGGIACP